MKDNELDQIISEAFKKANDLKHEYLTLELIFWVLLQVDENLNLLEELGADSSSLIHEIELFLNESSHFSLLS